MSLVERRVAADPERALGHEIRVREGAGDAVAHAAEGGLADEVPAEEKARRDSVRLEEAHEVVPAVPRVGPHRDREAEPARLGAVRRLREDEFVLIARECLAEEGVVATAGGLVAYSGGRVGYGQLAEFTPVANYPGLAARVRATLGDLKVSPVSADVADQRPLLSTGSVDRVPIKPSGKRAAN